jgi:hypothetical protein
LIDSSTGGRELLVKRNNQREKPRKIQVRCNEIYEFQVNAFN